VNCHKSATSSSLYAAANAGDTVEFKWSGWPEGHNGPIINYIAPCNGECFFPREERWSDVWTKTNDDIGDCTKLASSSLRWSKISQAAIVSPGVWVTDTLIKNKFRSSTVLPAKLAPGNYVIRHEIIALHAAGSDNGAQFYPQVSLHSYISCGWTNSTADTVSQCLNLKIGGSGKVAATGGVAGTTLYKRDDAGIKFNLYTNPTTYPFPGPALWTAAN
jgi:cellulase